jgi:IS605 OrfB family transposase
MSTGYATVSDGYASGSNGSARVPRGAGFRRGDAKKVASAANVNHTISKRIVAEAECTRRAIALENLEGIRARIKARRPQRATLHSWAFHQLRRFVAYKAALAGVPVVYVDPRNTSRMCPGADWWTRAIDRRRLVFSVSRVASLGTRTPSRPRTSVFEAVMRPYAAGVASYVSKLLAASCLL